MNNLVRTALVTVFLAIAFLAMSPPARASDFTGFLALFIALPILLISTGLAGIFYLLRRRWPGFRTRWLSIVLFFPVLLLSAFVFFIDVLPSLPKIDPGNPNDHGIAFFVGYIGIFSVLCWLCVLLIKGRPPSSRK